MPKNKLKDIKTATITSKGQICIPSDARSEGFKEGSKISIIVYSNRIELRPMEQLNEELSALISEDVLAKEWNTKEEDEAWQDL